MKRLLLIATLASCASPSASVSPWNPAAPEDAGFDAGAIATLVEELRRGDHGVVDHFVLIRDGLRVVDERFDATHDEVLIDQSADPPPAMYDYSDQRWHPYREGTELHTMQSTTKSVVSIAIGMAIADGALPGVETPVLPYLQGRPIHPDPRWSDLTVADLLTMRSGLEWSPPEGTTGYTAKHPTTLMERSDAWIPFILERSMRVAPGTEFEYVDAASVLLGEVFVQAVGERLDRYLDRRLFEPLGIDDWYWKVSPAGELDTEGGLYLTADGLARLGQLCLDEGRWNDAQLVPAAWIAESTAPHVDRLGDNTSAGYGYQWWVPHHTDGATDVYCASGFGGQFLIVSPATRTIAVFLGWDPVAGTVMLFEPRILGAL